MALSHSCKCRLCSLLADIRLMLFFFLRFHIPDLYTLLLRCLMSLDGGMLCSEPLGKIIVPILKDPEFLIGLTLIFHIVGSFLLQHSLTRSGFALSLAWQWPRSHSELGTHLNPKKNENLITCRLMSRLLTDFPLRPLWGMFYWTMPLNARADECHRPNERDILRTMLFLLYFF